jgi:hypothetical protein
MSGKGTGFKSLARTNATNGASTLPKSTRSRKRDFVATRSIKILQKEGFSPPGNLGIQGFFADKLKHSSSSMIDHVISADNTSGKPEPGTISDVHKQANEISKVLKDLMFSGDADDANTTRILRSISRNSYPTVILRLSS